MTVRVAVIGAGTMGSDHARVLGLATGLARVQVVCDVDQARARAIAEEVGAKDISSDPLACVSSVEVDGVVVASPDDTHVELTIAAIKAGKHVLCEKPLASESTDCLRVLNAEAQAGRRLVQVGFMRRFDLAYEEMMAAVSRGIIGRSLLMHTVHRNVAAPKWFTPDMVVTNSAPHDFDITRAVLRAELTDVVARSPAAAGNVTTGAPVFMLFSTDKGQAASVEVNVNAGYGYEIKGELVGETGTIRLHNPSASEINSGLALSVTYAKDGQVRFADAYRKQDVAWIKSISTGVPVGASAWDGYCVTVVAEAVLAAVRSGEKVPIHYTRKPSIY